MRAAAGCASIRSAPTCRCSAVPLTEADISHLAEPANVPDPLSRAPDGARRARRAGERAGAAMRADDDYGAARASCCSRPAPIRRRRSPVARRCASATCATSRRRRQRDGWAHEAVSGRHRSRIDPRARPRAARRGIGDGAASLAHASTTASRARSAAASTSALPARRRRSRRSAARRAARLLQPAARCHRRRRPAADRGQPDLRGDAGLQGRRGHRRRARRAEVVVAARNGARPLIAAGGDVTLQIGARGTAGARWPGDQRRRAAPRRRGRQRAARAGVARLHAGARPRAQPDGSAVSPGAPSLIVEHRSRRSRWSAASRRRCRVAATPTSKLVDCIVDAGAPMASPMDGRHRRRARRGAHGQRHAR